MNTSGWAVAGVASGTNTVPAITMPNPAIVSRHSPKRFTSGPIRPPCTSVATTPTTRKAAAESPGPQPNISLK